MHSSTNSASPDPLNSIFATGDLSIKRFVNCAVFVISALAVLCAATPSSAQDEEFFIGQIVQTAARFCNNTMLEANGQVVSIAPYYTVLFAVYGTRFGGDGQTTFGLPDLTGSESNPSSFETFGLRWCVAATRGRFPTRSVSPSFESAPSGLIISVGGDFCPETWRETASAPQPKIGQITHCEAGTGSMTDFEWYTAQIFTINSQTCPSIAVPANGASLDGVLDRTRHGPYRSSLVTLFGKTYGSGAGGGNYLVPDIASPGPGQMSCIVRWGKDPYTN